MADDEVRFREAGLPELEVLLRLQAEFYREEGYAHREQLSRRAWEQFLSDHRWGRAWLGESRSEPLGYVALSLGYSLEFLGPNAFVDELYVAPAWRGRGVGHLALEAAFGACGSLGVKGLHLEVERDKHRLREFYRRVGFVEHESFMMTKWLGLEAERPSRRASKAADRA